MSTLSSTRSSSRREGRKLDFVTFPMGGIGAGMICLEGTGALSHFSLRHHPNLSWEPFTFAAISIQAPKKIARVLQGQVPRWKLSPRYVNDDLAGLWGLPRFHQCSFSANFPFCEIDLEDRDVPLRVRLIGWSPFEAGDPDNASLPVAALEYEFRNESSEAIDAVFSFHAQNFMAQFKYPWDGDKAQGCVREIPGGFILSGTGPTERPVDEGSFAAWVDDPAVKSNCRWTRAGIMDCVPMAWRDVVEGACYEKASQSGYTSPGATLFVPFSVAPGATKSIQLKFAWYVGQSDLRIRGSNKIVDILNVKKEQASGKETHRPWYAGRFTDVGEIVDYWRGQYSDLRKNSSRFSRCFHDSTLPPEVIEAVAANLSTLKSPTILRQIDGRLWGWEGSGDSGGAGSGSATHVWNYAQSIAHLFPTLERTLRETEFGPSQNEMGHQDCRSALPIRPTKHDSLAAADGQLGGIVKAYRDWRICGDLQWLRALWPRIRASLDYCIRTWDPGHSGCLEEPRLTTYDVMFWSADSLCTGLYLAALTAAERMGSALGDNVEMYRILSNRACQRMEDELFDGDYFSQKADWPRGMPRFLAQTEEDLEYSGGPYSPEAMAIARKEGPRYQYTHGCHADGVMGAWLASVCGLKLPLDTEKLRLHLQSVYRNNLKRDLTEDANPRRGKLAAAGESGLVLCTWPKGKQPTLPLFFHAEVWSGVEHEVASHLMMLGNVDAGLDVVRSCRSRYDGGIRNPFAEVEAGQWYARAMSSYALLQGLTGARYDAVDKILYLEPALKGDWRSFLSTATGYGSVGVKEGKPFLEVASGEIPCNEIRYQCAAQAY